MRNLKNLINIAAVAVISVFVFSCSDKTTSTKEYYSLIPLNSFYVAGIDFARLDKDMGLTDEQIERLTEEADKSGFGMDELDVLVENSAKFDESEPVYAFVTTEYAFGVVAKIDKSQDFTTTFDLLIDKLDLKSDTTVVEYALASNKDMAIAYEGESFIFMLKNKEIKSALMLGTDAITGVSVKEEVESVMSGKTASFASTESFKTLRAGKNDIGFVTVVDENYPIFKLPFKFVSITSQDFESGKIVMKTDVQIEKCDFLTLIEKYAAKPKGKFDKYIPSDYILYANGACSKDGDNKELLKKTNELIDIYIESISNSMATINSANGGTAPQLTQGLTTANNVVKEILENVIYSFNGESVFTINTMTMMPELVFMADVKDAKILDNLIANIPANMLVKNGDNQYTVKTPFVNVEVGVKNNVLYITNATATFNAFNEDKALENNFTSTPFAKKVKGSYGGMDIRVDALMNSPLVQLGMTQIGGKKLPVVFEIENFEMISTEITSVVATLNMKDKEANALNTIMLDIFEFLPTINK